MIVGLNINYEKIAEALLASGDLFNDSVRPGIPYNPDLDEDLTDSISICMTDIATFGAAGLREMSAACLELADELEFIEAVESESIKVRLQEQQQSLQGLLLALCVKSIGGDSRKLEVASNLVDSGVYTAEQLYLMTQQDLRRAIG